MCVSLSGLTLPLLPLVRNVLAATVSQPHSSHTPRRQSAHRSLAPPPLPWDQYRSQMWIPKDVSFRLGTHLTRFVSKEESERCQCTYLVQVEQLGNFKIVHEVEGTGEKTEFRFHTKSKLQGGASVTVS